MITRDRQKAFEDAATKAPTFASVRDFAERARAGATDAVLGLAASFAHVAFVAPEARETVYGAFCAGWFGEPADGIGHPPSVLLPPLATQELWAALWELVETGAPDPGAFTARVTSLGAYFDPAMRERAEAIARAHPKAADAATRGMPPRIELPELARQPTGSLGHEFYRLIVDNGFDLEVLDRDALALASLPPALRYLNTRILQMHDVWHLVGGYRTTALHEIGISAFQLAQFAHGYSGMLLATVATGAAMRTPESAGVLLQTIAEGTAHGLSTPSFMAIAWEQEWHLPIAEIRARHAIEAFQGSFPADLFEQLRAAA